MTKLTWAALVLILICNAVVLAGVAWNRSGVPVSSLELTERELMLHKPYRGGDENSGTSLNLEWRTLGMDEPGEYIWKYRSHDPVWLDRGKLQQLGFDLTRAEELDLDRRHHALSESHPVILVMEYDGAAYQQALLRDEVHLKNQEKKVAEHPEDATQAEKLKRLQELRSRLLHSESRLYAIDAGTDLAVLQERHADAAKLLFVHGRVGVRWQNEQPTGYIQALAQELIHVPLEHATTLGQIPGRPLDVYGDHDEQQRPTPRYRVRLNIGQRLEPWIGELKAIPAQ